MRFSSILTVCLFAALGAPAGETPPQPAPQPQPPKVVKVTATTQAAEPMPAEWEKLFTELTGTDAAPRGAAAKELLKKFEAPLKAHKDLYLNKIAAEVAKDDAKAREAAVLLIAEAIKDLRKGAERVLVGQILLINGLDEKERDAALLQFTNMLSDSIVGNEVEKVLPDYMSNDAGLVAAAPQTLLALGAESATHLSNALEDERLPVRKGAADALKALGPLAKDAANDLSFLLDNDDKLTRRYAAQILQNLGPDAIDVAGDMVQYLDHDEKPVRRYAADILKKMGAVAGEEVAVDLAGLLTGDDKNTRALATEVLLNLGPAAKDAGEDLIDIIDDTDNDTDSRTRAAEVLGAIGTAAKDHLKLLKQHLDDQSPAVKAAVTEAVSKIETGGK